MASITQQANFQHHIYDEDWECLELALKVKNSGAHNNFMFDDVIVTHTDNNEIREVCKVVGWKSYCGANYIDIDAISYDGKNTIHGDTTRKAGVLSLNYDPYPIMFCVSPDVYGLPAPYYKGVPQWNLELNTINIKEEEWVLEDEEVPLFTPLLFGCDGDEEYNPEQGRDDYTPTDWKFKNGYLTGVLSSVLLKKGDWVFLNNAFTKVTVDHWQQASGSEPFVYITREDAEAMRAEAIAKQSSAPVAEDYPYNA